MKFKKKKSSIVYDPERREQWIVELTEELNHRRTEELNSVDTSPPPEGYESIYRVPIILTKINNQAYKPKLVSLGPLHRSNRDLHQMEKHKRRALIQFLLRIAKSGQTPQHVLIAMEKIKDSLLAHYGDALPLPYEYDFLKLMILDSCFVLEFMLAAKRCATNEQNEYDLHDPVFGFEKIDNIVPNLKRDMLLLENQLPLLALTTLAGIPGSEIGNAKALIIEFYKKTSSKADEIINEWSYHILDLYRKISISEGEYLPSNEKNLQSATDLKNAGVSFYKSGSNSYRDISFNNGFLSLPPLHIDEATPSLLLNLMAFERLHWIAGNEVTAYVYFMDGLINTADDVALLRTKGILTGLEGLNQTIAHMINNLTIDISLVVFKRALKLDVNKNLNSYYKKRMQKTYRLMSSFVQTYFKSPWVFLSVLGALFLLTLTIIQTVYSMLQYYHA